MSGTLVKFNNRETTLESFKVALLPHSLQAKSAFDMVPHLIMCHAKIRTRKRLSFHTLHVKQDENYRVIEEHQVVVYDYTCTCRLLSQPAILRPGIVKNSCSFVPCTSLSITAAYFVSDLSFIHSFIRSFVRSFIALPRNSDNNFFLFHLSSII